MLVWDRIYDFDTTVPFECYKQMKNKISHQEIQYNQNPVRKLSPWSSRAEKVPRTKKATTDRQLKEKALFSWSLAS